MMHVKAATVVDLIDACYDSAESRAGWAKRVLESVMTMSKAHAGSSFHFSSGYADKEFLVRSMAPDVAIGLSSESVRQALAANLHAPSALLEVMIGRTQATTLASLTGLGADLAATPGFRDCWSAPVIDSLGVVALDPNGNGFTACVGLDHLATLSPRESRLLAKLAAHIGAGDRLRRGERAIILDDAEAILRPDGKVLHAQGAALENRDALDDGRRRRDEARQTAHDVDKALDIWRGLIAGRWSLVDHFDTDGKRFLLAMKNTATVDKRGVLTPRERRVCALVARGHGDKEVAYMLGISQPSVSASLHRARAKLGVKSRADLARAWRRAP